MSKSKIFLAILLIGIGIFMALNTALEWNKEVLPIAGAIAVITLGVIIIMPRKRATEHFQQEDPENHPDYENQNKRGSGPNKGQSHHSFSERVIPITTPKSQYTTTFAKTTYDFRKVELTETIYCSINVVFGEALILINPDTAVTIDSSVSFGEAVIPGTITTAFGNSQWSSKQTENGAPVLNIRLHTAFASSKIIL